MLQYLKVLDPINAKIIEGLGKHGSRNISSLAKSIGLPSTTVSFRIKKLMNRGYLSIKAKLDSPKLGLMKGVLFADTRHGFEDKLLKAIENVGYWTYIAPCYGKFSGFYAVFSFPALFKEKLENYLGNARQAGVLSNYMFHWTTNIHEVAPNFEWFDFDRKAWRFSWDKWVTDVMNGSQRLPEHLKDPKICSVEVDETDLLMLKEMEKDGTLGFTDLAKTVKITPQAVRHRYNEHVVKKSLVAEYEVAVLPYPLQSSDMCAVFLDFENEKPMAKFANSLRDKPFFLNYGKVIGQNSIVAHSYTPKMQFSSFMNTLSRFVGKGVLKDFFYVTLDAGSFKRQTVSYEHFKNGKWTYDQEEKMRKLATILPLRAA